MHLLRPFFLLLLVQSAAAEEMRGFATVAMKSALERLAPQFSEGTGDQVTIAFTSSADATTRVRRGEPADFVIVARSNIDDLLKEGRVKVGSDVDIAVSKLGMAARNGAAPVAISTVEDVRRVFAQANAVATSDPSSGGLAGLAFVKALDRLGLAEEMRGKIIHPDKGQPASDLVISGKADLIVSQMSELVRPGLAIVGALPDEMQSVQRFVFAIPASSLHHDAARALGSFLRSSQSAAVFKTMSLDAPD